MSLSVQSAVWATGVPGPFVMQSVSVSAPTIWSWTCSSHCSGSLSCSHWMCPNSVSHHNTVALSTRWLTWLQQHLVVAFPNRIALRSGGTLNPSGKSWMEWSRRIHMGPHQVPGFSWWEVRYENAAGQAHHKAALSTVCFMILEAGETIVHKWDFT